MVKCDKTNRRKTLDGCAARAHAILRAEHVALAGRLDLLAHNMNNLTDRDLYVHVFLTW